jgi:peptide/nickel transport system substrate-binding protein
MTRPTSGKESKMTRSIMRVLVGAVLIAAWAFLLTACGDGGDDGGGGGQAGGAETEPVEGQKKGGTLKVLSIEGFEHLDPGSSYFQLDYEVVYAVHRPLYSFKPEDALKPVPDLAASEPRISPDEKTVTIELRRGVRYSPGTVNRTVTSADVKYAIERGFNPSVANGYAPSYFGSVRGADKAKGGPIAGIETPDEQTIVFRLTEPFGSTLAQALTLPLSAPVPREYAQRFDRTTPSKYDSDPTVQAFTGPYVIRAYRAGRRLTLGRNTNWKADTDYRPAYLDAVDWTIGAEPNVAGRQILTGRDLVNGDTPAAPTVKLGVQRHNDQISFTPLGNRFITLNTAIEPFDDPNLRKAVGAAIDRVAMQRTRGGRVAGDIATHFLAPNAPGFDAAGGIEGPEGADWLARPRGDRELAAEYMRKAGFSDGRYDGPPILMVGTTEDPADKTAQVVLNAVRSLGFRVNFRSVPQETMLSRFCGVVEAKVHVCPSVGWLPDFSDGFAWLYPVFSGKAIVPVNNSNMSQLNDPEVNAAMERANAETDAEQRAELWGEVDALVTETAAAIPWFWDRVPNIQSSNVQGVIAQWNAAYDLAFTSLK